jgi:hypothetical protein
MGCGPLLASGSLSPQGGISYQAKDFRGWEPLRRAVEDAEKSFLETTGYLPGDEPAVLLATGGKGSSASLSVNALEGGVPEIRLLLPRDPEDPQVAQYLATALLLRHYYGKTAPVSGSRVPRYPLWMTRGLGALIFQRPLTDAVSPATPELEAFLTERMPDPENVSLLRRYDAVAALLVRSGLSDNRGKKAFRDWIGSYDVSVPSRQPSPWVDGWDMRSVERRWNLGLQAPGKEEKLPDRILSAASTLEEFRRIMNQGKDGKDSLADVARERGGEYRLRSLSERLVALRLQSNPLVVPVVEQSMKLVATAKRIPSKKCGQEEDRLRSEYLALVKRSRAIEDYLDWCEATKVTVPSGLFDRYLSAPTSGIGMGPIGRHLDAVEARGW